MHNIFKNTKKLKLGALCSMMVGLGTISMASASPVYAAEKDVSNDVAQETSELMNTMFGIQSYKVNKSQDSELLVESLVHETVLQSIYEKRPVEQQMPQSRTRSMESQEPIRFELIEKKTTKDAYHNTVCEDIYLYGDHLVSIQNFNPSLVGQQKVDVKVSLLSMIDKQIVQTLKNTEYIQEGTPVTKQSILLNVVDVTAPTIQMTKTEDTIDLNGEFDIHTYISSITDDVDTEIDINIEGNVDVNTEGDYTVKITVTDDSENVSSENFIAHVKESTGSKIAKKALTYRGVPYVWGGTSPYGFDCSGLVQYVYRQYGISLPRVSQAQMHCGVGVNANQMKPGDLVIYGGGVHVAIYIGNGQVVHALNPETGVTVGPWNTAYNGGVSTIRHII